METAFVGGPERFDGDCGARPAAVVEKVVADHLAGPGFTAMEAARDARASDTAVRRLLAVCRAMREWAITHPGEFGWMFASPIPSPNRQRPDSLRNLAAQDFQQVFLGQIEQLWAADPFPAIAIKFS